MIMFIKGLLVLPTLLMIVWTLWGIGTHFNLPLKCLIGDDAWKVPFPWIRLLITTGLIMLIVLL